ncbi:DUF7948 domain-containing protein [Aurantibacillus circumpalustris]|uniref:DUF7948 domain-containing protein n=1 Tax=Aurantibacillus circumpalustris TaxID=3036359 RepID=UPI00295BDCBC|nr:gliding motility-associated C-terminal domain-containing protein [Aurantibacillus circumpalustris]
MKRSLCVLSLMLSSFFLCAGTPEKTTQTSLFPSPSQNFDVPASFKTTFSEKTEGRFGFEKNKGQWPEQVEYKADLGSGRRIFFEKNKFTYVVYNPDDLYRAHENEHDKRGSKNELINIHAFEMVFVNANTFDIVQGSGMTNFYYNYFLGNDPSKWASEVPVFRNLSYSNLYDGIDLVAYQKDNDFKYDYIVKPGADVKHIQLKFNGANKLEIKNNNLHIVTSVGDVVESIPTAYQIIDGKEVKINCEYKLANDGETVSFYFPEGYDSNYELIIDPIVVASTYSGSTATTYGHCATYDGLGNIYSGGRCFAIGYPVSTGAAQVTFGGQQDIAISKLNPTGSALIYATYLGGSAEDNPHSMFVNSSNELYVYGSTGSANFPTTTGAYDVTHNGLSDMVVCKLNPTGTTLLGSTYIGGSANDGFNNGLTYNYADAYRGEIVLNSNSEVFIVGTSESTNFPATTGAYDVTHNGTQDAVVLKLNASLTTLQWATYIGGAGQETGCSIRLNASGDVYVVGLTAGNGFPATTGAYMTTFQGGSYDGFVARLNSTGSTLLSSTYVGTGGKDIVYLIDIDINNDIYIYGISDGTFPIVGSVYFNANSINILAKLNPALSTVLFFSNLGNNTKNPFSPTALLVDLCGNIYMSGWGTVASYPTTTNAAQSTTLASGFHIMVLSQNASSLLYGSYYGGGGEHVDGGTSRFDPNGFVYQAVCACGTFPTLPTAFSQTKQVSGCDIAVFKIDFEVNCNPLITNTTVCMGRTATISITNVNGLVNPTFSLQPGGVVSSTPFFTVAPLVTTVYTLFITGTNGFSTVVTNTGISTVSIAPVPQISPSLTQAACSSTFNAFDIGLTFLPAGPTPTYAVFWTPIPAGITTPTQTGATGGIAPGAYFVKVFAANGCTNSATFTMNPIPTSVAFNLTGPLIIDCNNPTITVNASPTTYSYTWFGLTATYTGSSASFIQGQSGTWTVNAVDLTSGCGGTHTLAIGQNITVSTSSINPPFQNITCSVTSVITVTAAGNPSVNTSHYWISPTGGTLTMNNNPAYFLPGTPGTYTHVLVNDANGCSVSKTFTVASNSGFPTFSVSSPQNFTLGCSSKSTAIINIVNAQTTPVPGGPVSYTILGPPTNTIYVPGTSSTYTVSTPGTWTIITKDNTNLCESKVQVSVLQNVFSPAVSAIIPVTRLTCYTPSMVIVGTSTTQNTSFIWNFPGVPNSLLGSSLTVFGNTLQTTNTLVANYTLTVTDDNNTCKSSTIIPIEQNFFPPKVLISGGEYISCNTLSVTLTNQSSTTIPPVFGIPNLPVIGYVWTGPSPQEEKQLVSTYVGFVTGTYTMVAKDLNNGCLSVGTKSIDDFRDYPEITRTAIPDTIDCGSKGKTISPDIIGSNKDLVYNWIAVPGATISSPGSKNLIVTSSGQYNIIITNTVNGCITSGLLEVVDGTLQAGLSADKVSGYAPLEVNFTNTSNSSDFLTGKNNIASYWNFGNGTSQSGITQMTMAPVRYTQAGSYIVTLFANKGDCRDSASIRITVDIPSELVIPNIFTPNGDGNNDLFFIKASNLNKIDMLIVDRWGTVVYELSSETGNIEWDGKNQQGKESAEGVYLYTLKANGKDGQSFNKNGSITLIR